MTRLKLILTLTTTLTLLKVNGQVQLGQIPLTIKQTADSIINLTLGTTYSNGVEFQCEESMLHIDLSSILNDCQYKQKKSNNKRNRKKTGEPTVEYFILTYRLTFKPTVTYEFDVRIDKKHKLVYSVDLPDCATTNACDIKVDSLAAIDFAMKSGLKTGLGISNDGLTYDNETKTFQWIIKTKTKPNQGDAVYIDAQTGQRLTEKDANWYSNSVD